MLEWTPAQKNAIDSRNGTILVSAAAGSGKTAVLVERVIQRIEDEDNICPADSLLVVTFTKAATSQMREKISAALDKRIEQNPQNEHLQKQRILLPFATISTIDSFCGDLVKENFHDLGISPDYKIVDGAELMLMKQDAAELVLEKAYKENREGFSELLNILYSKNDDSKLSELIINLYNTSRAYAYPDKWLDSFLSDYENVGDFKETKWGKYICEYLKELFSYNLTKLSEQRSMFDFEMQKSNGELFDNYISYLENFISLIDTGKWDDLVDYSQFFNGGRIKNSKKYSGYEVAKSVRDSAKKEIETAISSFFGCSQAEFEEDVAHLIPVIKELVNLVKDFNKELSEIKNNADAADFSDICAYAIKLLVKDVDFDGNPVQTELAKVLSEKYTEILVDEFQDINEQQNLLFKVLSKNGNNLFMVGDVKQSIYKFRLAMPEIFINIKKSLPDYFNENYPARINLDYNFRSRKGVTDYVNFVFRQLMSEKIGDVEYDINEELKPKALYSEREEPDTEIFILKDTDEFKKHELEAEYAARYIEKSIKNGLTVKYSDGVRKAEYRDFCILLRTAKSKMDIFISAFKRHGIPCYASNSEGFFKTTEIRTALSIMRVVDNPFQDIPLLSAMLSPIFGFTPDELASLRNDYPGCPLWICVKKASENGKRKCASFIEEIKRLRTLSVTLGAGEFVRELMDSTGYMSMVRAMSNGSQRVANLSLLLDYAEKYEQTGHVGVSGLIRFIDRIEKSDKDLETANEIPETANVVRIMTIHKSKGLEFPVCILADCSTQFINDFSMDYVTFMSSFGLGFKRVVDGKRFETLPYSAIAAAHKRANRSEDLRLLYVALTRAREKNVCLIQCNDPEKKIEKTMLKLDDNQKIAPINVYNCSSFSDMLLMPTLKHFDSNSIPLVSAIRNVKTLPCESRININIIDDVSSENESEIIESVISEENSELIDEITKRLEYEYPYSNLSTLVAKLSPSQLEDTEGRTEYFAKAKPKFLTDSDVQSASKGTAVHKFMEFYDYSSSEKDVHRQAEKMVKENKLSPAEEKLLEYEKLDTFFSGSIAKRIEKSSVLEREKKITFSVGADEIYGNEFGHDEKIVIQGYIDCAFIEDGKWIIVDYKTDRIKSMETLVERYSGQLKLYERGLFECTGIPVKETVIYSLYKNDIIILN